MGTVSGLYYVQGLQSRRARAQLAAAAVSAVMW